MKRFLALLLTGAMAFSVAACGTHGTAADDEEASTELNIYMWENYISDELIANFEAENNCTVNLSYMKDQADSLEKLTAESEDFDLVMTCNAYMKYLTDEDYVRELDKKNIPNSSNINDSFWVSKKYGIPYLMNYIYVVYDSATCPVEIKGYNDLLDPALKGKVSAVDGAANLFPMALVALGYDPNSTEESELEEACDWLEKFNENVVAYGNAEQHLIDGTASVALTYDGNASWAMSKKNTIKVAPFEKDAIQLDVDMFVIPTGAKHVDLAEKFLNYICDPEVMAPNLDAFPYSCPNAAAVMIASEAYKNDSARNFDYKENVFFQKEMGEVLEIYNDFYQKLTNGKTE